MENNLKNELRDYLKGNEPVGQENIVRTIRNYLRASQSTSRKIEEGEFSKKQEVKILTQWINKNNFWFIGLNPNTYFAEGAEQKVYLLEKEKEVIKANTAVFYEFWADYFDNLLLHNFFFSATEYKLLGFTKEEDEVRAIVKQTFVESNQDTDLENVKKFLKANGFEHSKNNDYYNNEYGIILEDLHDENVLTCNNVLFFVDTVFYLREDFLF
jgi:Serine/Threonine/Tyrosine Kinase found in polyvalent proteins